MVVLVGVSTADFLFLQVKTFFSTIFCLPESFELKIQWKNMEERLDLEGATSGGVGGRHPRLNPSHPGRAGCTRSKRREKTFVSQTEYVSQTVQTLCRGSKLGIKNQLRNAEIHGHFHFRDE